MIDSALIVFIKNFHSGKVKSRLGRTIGYDKALSIYKDMTAFTISEALSAGSPVHLYFSDYVDTELMNRWTLANSLYPVVGRVQKGETLGEKMHRSFKEVLRNHDSALLMGTDCPYFDRKSMVSALDRLQAESGVVIGPAEDGGYYAIGMKYANDVFTDIEWSTDRVLDQTLHKIKQNGLTFTKLKCYSDIDTESDWDQFLKSSAAAHFYSIIRASSSRRDTDEE